MERVLVTGGAGFIGSNFVRYALARQPSLRVWTLDALTYAGNRENLVGPDQTGRHTFIHGDIRDRALVLETLVRHEIDTVVHFAAETHVDRSIDGPIPFVETNVLGTVTLLEAVRAAWVASAPPRADVRFHHISTDEVYGALGPDEPAFEETTPLAPKSPYSASKAASDHLVRAYAHTHGLPVTLSHCSNNYGPFQFPEKLIPLVIALALEGAPLPIYGDGLQIRDWIYVDDHCAGIWAVLTRGRVGETYNLGGENQPTNREVVQAVCALLDRLTPRRQGPYASLMRSVADRRGHDRRYAINAAKARRELGWAPPETLASGLEKTVRWYLENRAWTDAVRARPGYQAWIHQNYVQRKG